jgi:hypothetical protein
MTDKITDYYEIKIVRRRLIEQDGMPDVEEEQNVMEATVPASTAPALLHSTADSINTTRKATSWATVFKAVGDAVKEAEANAQAKGEPSFLDILKGKGTTSTSGRGNTNR